MVKAIPVTVFTGFLGAGKTSIILSLLPLLPPNYKACLLKNEYGDIEVDSQLAKQSSLAGVNEILNGCMCCVLVGQMKTALLEIKEKFNPDRIFVETSGSAFPATLAFQIRELEREYDGAFKLDAIVTVIDAENFIGYEDTSPTARMQASYTDLIIVNKWEHISERQLDIVMDHLHTLNDLTPKIRCNGKNGIDPELIFGLDSKLFQLENGAGGKVFTDSSHNDEVETVTVWRGEPGSHTCHGCHDHAEVHSQNVNPASETPVLTEELLVSTLNSLPKESVWRVKGFVTLSSPPGSYILNWAFGRFELEQLEDSRQTSDSVVRLTIMGERGEMRRMSKKLASTLGAELH